VLLLVALAGLSAMLVLTLAAGEDWLSPRGLLYSAMAGISGALGITALYRGLTLGNTAFVAPLSAVIGATTPVLFEFARGNSPEISQLAGFVLALSGIWLVSLTAHMQSAERFNGWPQALIAGLGFGGFFVLITQVPDDGIFHAPGCGKSVTILLALAVWVSAATICRRRTTPSPCWRVIGRGGKCFYLLALPVGAAGCGYCPFFHVARGGGAAGAPFHARSHHPLAVAGSGGLHRFNCPHHDIIHSED
jgi:uncharacterized membrane protein